MFALYKGGLNALKFYKKSHLKKLLLRYIYFEFSYHMIFLSEIPRRQQCLTTSARYLRYYISREYSVDGQYIKISYKSGMS